MEGWVLRPEACPYLRAVDLGHNDPKVVAQSSRTQLTVVGAVMAAPDLEKQYPVGRIV